MIYPKFAVVKVVKPKMHWQYFRLAVHCVFGKSSNKKFKGMKKAIIKLELEGSWYSKDGTQIAQVGIVHGVRARQWLFYISLSYYYYMCVTESKTIDQSYMIGQGQG